MRFSLLAFKLMFVLLILCLSAPASYAAVGPKPNLRCGSDSSVSCEQQQAGGSLRGMSEDDGEATNGEAPEASAPEATNETSSEEAAVEPAAEAEAPSDEASSDSSDEPGEDIGDVGSDGGSEEEESDDTADSDEEYEE